MSKGNIYIDCTSGISGDMLSQCLTELSESGSFVEEQQQLVSDELRHDAQPYTHRSFQSILGLLSDCQLNDDVKAMTLKIYTILAAAEAQVHGETLETVHFHEVGRPQAIINMVGIAAALMVIKTRQVYCSKIIDGIGMVKCAHGEIQVPVPAVRAMMNTSKLPFANEEVEMEMVTPTGLAALLAMEPQYMAGKPEPDHILQTAEARGDRWKTENSLLRGLKITLFQG